MIKTNAMRIIEKEGVTYNVHTYDGGALSGVEVAAVLGQDADRVYKTLVTTAGAGRFYVFVVPVASELDLKKQQKRQAKKRWKCYRRNLFCLLRDTFTAVVRLSG